MPDILTKKQRSFNMSRIKGKNTGPEMALKQYLRKQGLRGYRVHSSLPGKPDIVFPKYGLTVFVDGCFWHKCKKCFTMPETNRAFWRKKIEGNVKRDREINKMLKKKGYTVLRIPEHQIREDLNSCYSRILDILTIKGFKHGDA